MSALSDSPALRFVMSSDLAMVAYFIKGNWPTPETMPELELESSPMMVSFRFDAEVVRDLQRVLSRALVHDGSLARSARAFRMALEARLRRRVIPSSGRAPDALREQAS